MGKMEKRVRILWRRVSESWLWVFARDTEERFREGRAAVRWEEVEVVEVRDWIKAARRVVREVWRAEERRRREAMRRRSVVKVDCRVERESMEVETRAASWEAGEVVRRLSCAVRDAVVVSASWMQVVRLERRWRAS